MVPLDDSLRASASARVGGDRLQALWSGPHLRILVVEDDEDGMLFVRRVLEGAGHAVREARDGEEARAILERESFSVVLMDIHMPFMSGLEAIRWIRDNEQKTGVHVPVIAMTARAHRHERDKIVGHGFDGYLAKPILIETLFDEIRRCLPDPIP